MTRAQRPETAPLAGDHKPPNLELPTATIEPLIFWSFIGLAYWAGIAKVRQGFEPGPRPSDYVQQCLRASAEMIPTIVAIVNRRDLIIRTAAFLSGNDQFARTITQFSPDSPAMRPGVTFLTSRRYLHENKELLAALTGCAAVSLPPVEMLLEHIIIPATGPIYIPTGPHIQTLIEGLLQVVDWKPNQDGYTHQRLFTNSGDSYMLVTMEGINVAVVPPTQEGLPISDEEGQLIGQFHHLLGSLLVQRGGFSPEPITIPLSQIIKHTGLGARKDLPKHEMQQRALRILGILSRVKVFGQWRSGRAEFHLKEGHFWNIEYDRVFVQAGGVEVLKEVNVTFRPGIWIERFLRPLDQQDSEGVRCVAPIPAEALRLSPVKESLSARLTLYLTRSYGNECRIRIEKLLQAVLPSGELAKARRDRTARARLVRKFEDAVRQLLSLGYKIQISGQGAEDVRKFCLDSDGTQPTKRPRNYFKILLGAVISILPPRINPGGARSGKPRRVKSGRRKKS